MNPEGPTRILWPSRPYGWTTLGGETTAVLQPVRSFGWFALAKLPSDDDLDVESFSSADCTFTYTQTQLAGVGTTNSVCVLGAVATLALDVKTTVIGTTRSVSTVNVAAQLIPNRFASAESYSLGFSDPDNETSTDSNSQPGSTTAVVFTVTAATSSLSKLGVFNGGVFDASTGISRSVSAVTGQWASAVIEKPVSGTTNSRSVAGVVVGNTVEDTATGVTDSQSTVGVTAGSTIIASVSGVVDSRSTLAVVTGDDGNNFSTFGVTDSQSTVGVTAAGTVIADVAGVTDSLSSVSVISGNTVVADVSGVTDSRSTVDVTAGNTINSAASGVTDSRSTVDVTAGSDNMVTATAAGTTASVSTASVVSETEIADFASGGVASVSRITADVDDFTYETSYEAQADAESYSLGIVDPETELQADSFSEFDAAVTEIDRDIVDTIASVSVIGVGSESEVFADVGAATTSVSRVAVAAAGAAYVSASRSGTTGSTSTNSVVVGVPAVNFTRTTQTDSRSAVSVIRTPAIVFARTARTDSRSAITTGAVTLGIDVLALAISESEPDPTAEFTELVTVNTAGVSNIFLPTWVRAIDTITLGAGGGSAGSGALAVGRGGEGGNWQFEQVVVKQLTSGLIYDRILARVAVGAGGPGGAAGNGNGTGGGQSKIELFADKAGAQTLVRTLTSAGGAGGTGAGLVGTVQRDGGAAQNGNSPTVGGKDLLLAANLYTGGAAKAFSNALTPGNPPGGGGPGNSSGQNAGCPGANGRVHMFLYSGGDSEQYSYTVPGNYTTELPLTAQSVHLAAVGGGGGGGGGMAGGLSGVGGGGGEWKFTTSAISVKATVAEMALIFSITNPVIERLWIVVAVGAGGAGSRGGLVQISGGEDGTGSTATLKARVSGREVNLASVTSVPGSGYALGLINGKQVTGGNTNSGRDVRQSLGKNSYVFAGGRDAPPDTPGFAPGGGGGGGLSLVLTGRDGQKGGNGAVHIIYN